MGGIVITGYYLFVYFFEHIWWWWGVGFLGSIKTLWFVYFHWSFNSLNIFVGEISSLAYIGRDSI